MHVRSFRAPPPAPSGAEGYARMPRISGPTVVVGLDGVCSLCPPPLTRGPCIGLTHGSILRQRGRAGGAAVALFLLPPVPVAARDARRPLGQHYGLPGRCAGPSVAGSPLTRITLTGQPTQPCSLTAT